MKGIVSANYTGGMLERFVWIAFAGCAAAPPSPSPTCRAEEPVSVPIEPTPSRAFIFTVTVGDSPRELRFELDTGAATTYLDTRVAHELGLQPTGSTTVHGSGREPLRVDQVAHVTFGVGGLVSRDHTVHLADLSSVDDHIDGFLGGDFIARHVVTIDYERGRLHIADPCGFAYAGPGVVLPVTLEHGLPFVPATVKMEGSAAESSQVLVDTGSGDAVDHPAVLHAHGPVRHITTGVGLGAGTGEGVIAHAEYLELGAYRLPGALTACCGPNPDTNHLIGEEVLSRFTVVLDYAHHRIILERGKRFAEPFPDA
jgi:predicted aspartyl protease